MASIDTLRNLGPASVEQFARAGITTAEELVELGADAAYRKLLETGTRPHFIGYYVLHMALQGRPWNDCEGKEKAALRKAFDALKSGTEQKSKEGLPHELSRALDQLGVRPSAR